MLLFRNNLDYYVNGAKPTDEEYKNFFKSKRPTEDCDWFLAKRKHFAFFPKFLYEGYEDLDWINSFFHKLKQPTESQVRDALIFSIQDDCGDGPMNKYMLKAGGGSRSDSVFVSSFSIVTADPKTGLDTWRVIMKKYSTTFEDVLISYQELRDLFDQVATADQASARDRDSAKGYVALLMSAHRSGRIAIGNHKTKPCSTADLLEIIGHMKKSSVFQYVPEAIQFFKDRIKDSMTREFIEDKPGRNVTQEHRLSEAQRLKALEEVEDMFFGSHKTPVEPMQLTLFAA